MTKSAPFRRLRAANGVIPDTEKRFKMTGPDGTEAFEKVIRVRSEKTTTNADELRCFRIS